MKKVFEFTKKDFILLIILAVTVLMVDYSLRWYQAYKEHNLSTSIISQYISEIEPAEFQNYIAENNNIFVYMGVTDNQTCRTFENRLKKVIAKYNLRDEIVYLNVKGMDMSVLSNQYSADTLKAKNKMFADVPVIAVYKDTKVVDFIDYKNSDMKENSMVKLFRKYGFIDYND